MQANEFCFESYRACHDIEPPEPGIGFRGFLGRLLGQIATRRRVGSPSFFAVYRDQPVQIELWNLQPDDPHDFTLVGPNKKVLVTTMLEPLEKKSMILTFHREGLYHFRCNIHQPEMGGQILVLPPLHRN